MSLGLDAHLETLFFVLTKCLVRSLIASLSHIAVLISLSSGMPNHSASIQVSLGGPLLHLHFQMLIITLSTPACFHQFLSVRKSVCPNIFKVDTQELSDRLARLMKLFFLLLSVLVTVGNA